MIYCVCNNTISLQYSILEIIEEHDSPQTLNGNSITESGRITKDIFQIPLERDFLKYIGYCVSYILYILYAISYKFLF